MTSLGQATCRLDDHTIFHPFPSDARLRRLRWYTVPRKLKRTALSGLAPVGAPICSDHSSVDILRYKPERRVIAGVTLAHDATHSRRVLVRYATTPIAGLLASIAQTLRAAGVVTPEPLLQLEDARVSVDDFIDGIDLRDSVRTGAVDSRVVADALVRFHATQVAAPARSAVDDLEAAGVGLRGLAAWRPELAASCAAVSDALRRSIPDDSGPEVLLHGDLHDRNVMITQDGVAFVDLERVARGPAAIDLGRLRGIVAGMSIRQPGWSPGAVDHADAVVDHYRSQLDGRRIGDQALRWHTAIALVDEALLVTRHLERDCRTTAAAILDLARCHLDIRTR